jgi:hypothetical protein
VDVIEFWPEYGEGPLWTEQGQSVDLRKLPLAADLRDRLVAWNAAYDDSRLPFEDNDREWLDEGRRLFVEVRTVLSPGVKVVVTEPWWGEEPTQ